MLRSIRNLFLVGAFVMLTCNCMMAQDTPSTPAAPQPSPDKENFWDKIYIGGNLGLLFGSTTAIDISPEIGYRVTDKFIPGIGITYIYYRFNNPYSPGRFETSIYGGSVFTKYFFLQNLFAHVELEDLNLAVPKFITTQRTDLVREWIPSFYLGGGYSQSLGGHASLQLMILFEVLQNPNSLYYQSNPIIRIGFGF